MAVLVPIDDSEPAMSAVEHAAETFPDRDLTLLHVISPNTSMYGEAAAFAYDEIVESQREAAEELFEEVTDVFATHDRSVTTETIVGDPARSIVEFAENEGVDHIVIGSHGRSGASRVLLGSVAERVVRRAPVPVTVVR
ncbi:universal stress protein [Natrarchaeobius halalkaliphilus]|uniref:Universal stress protein n=1 Tax=Natrarchaeobius halalkaliphilus TaxID=1679091 RepID=A0A3N6LZ73_9EURY|nr:universal stress protein [Natrarchaeobius halalkaliphilus]RQG88033.1 universal stress protein [Natrarchaeobius halalkaliphilus]